MLPAPALAAGGQGTQPGERRHQVGGPGPGAVDADDDAAGVADDPAGDVPQPEPEGLGLGELAVAVQQQRLRPADQGLGDTDQAQPGVVGGKAPERQVAQPGGLGGADAVLHVGVGAVAGLQDGGVGVGLVRDEDLEAVPVLVGGAQLMRRAGVGPLTAADRPGALGPAGAGEIQVGELGDPGAAAGSAVGVQGGLPGRLGQGQDRGLDALVAVEPDREPQLAAGQFVDEGVGGAGGVGPDQDRP